jgi:hypothetical protein
MVDRFICRMHLPTGYRCHVESVVAVRPSATKRFQGGLLELYHSVRQAESEQDRRIVSILRDGFRIGYYGNKGPGVYLSNHSRYAWNWGGPVVLICHVPVVPACSIARFRSEIKSGSLSLDGSEYVVSDPSLVRVHSVVRFRVEPRIQTMDDVSRLNIGFVDHGHFGCPNCDPLVRRCDCALSPVVDPLDLVNISNT